MTSHKGRVHSDMAKTSLEYAKEELKYKISYIIVWVNIV